MSSMRDKQAKNSMELNRKCLMKVMSLVSWKVRVAMQGNDEEKSSFIQFLHLLPKDFAFAIKWLEKKTNK